MQVFKKNYVVILSSAAALALGLFLSQFLTVTGENGIKTVYVTKHGENDARLQELKDREEKDTVIGQFALNMMAECERYTPDSKKSSKAKKMILAQTIVRVTNSVFDNEQNKKDMIAAWTIESCFHKFAQSPTGPRGYSQVARAAFKEGMAACGIPDANDEDVWETDINLFAGACYFRSIIESKKDSYLAIIAYNQGPNSDAAKKYENGNRVGNLEALEYIARFSYLQRNIKETKVPGGLGFTSDPVSAKKATND